MKKAQKNQKEGKMNKPNKNNNLTTKRIEKSHKIVKNILQKYVDDANKMWNEMKMSQYMSEKWDKHVIGRS